MEYAVLKEWYEFELNNFPAIKPSIIIYLFSSPNIVLKRIQKRGRAEESNLNIETLKILHDLHEKWMNHLKSSESGVTIIELNANLPMEQAIEEYDRCLTEVFKLIKGKSMASANSGFTVIDKEAILIYKKLSGKARHPSKGSSNAVGFDLCR